MMQADAPEEGIETEPASVNWAKIIGLLCFTFGLIALIWVIRYLFILRPVTPLNT